ncbi:MAG: hypothetical protein E6H86_14930 [Chloroflexi bacterium]|nr:MAG: hypothetical protein E6H86_14930 [Chloroflexota bacterium]
MSQRAEALAERIEQGARALGTLAEGLSDSEWRTPVTPDGRTVGVMIHHVASMYKSTSPASSRTGKPSRASRGTTWPTSTRNTPVSTAPSQKATLSTCFVGTRRPQRKPFVGSPTTNWIAPPRYRSMRTRRSPRSSS